jgi:hypothetical protein
MSGLVLQEALGKQHAAPHVHLALAEVVAGQREARVLDHLVRLRLARLDGRQDRVQRLLDLEVQVLHAGGVDVAVLDQLAGGGVAVEAGHPDMALLAGLLPEAARLEDRADGREQEVGRGEEQVDVGVRGDRRLEVRECRGGVPLRGDLGDVEAVGALLDRGVEAVLAAEDGRLGDLGVVDDDDDALGEVRGRAVEYRDGMSASWASATMVVALSPSCGMRMIPSTHWAMQSRTCSSERLAPSLPLRSITVWPASVRVVVIAWWPATQNSVSRSWKAKQVVAAEALPPARAAPGEDGAGGEGLQSGGHALSPCGRLVFRRLGPGGRCP